VVKCLVFYHPDDPLDLLEQQERQLRRLQDACRKTRHELLLEVIVSRHGAVDAHTAARAVQRLYDQGMKPDWWKLEPAADSATWANIEHAIRSNDPLCRGVLLLGLQASEEALAASFRVAAASPIVKGFAVGRTIFADAAARWLAGDIDDDAAVADLAASFGTLVNAWRTARADASGATSKGITRKAV
jgi:5-dehydro-2-deoxygluconokinase